MPMPRSSSSVGQGKFPFRDPLVLSIHISQESPTHTPDELVEKAVQHYFSYRATLSRLELRRLLQEGRLSLLIGLVFLSGCLLIASLLRGAGTIWQVPREGLTIAGWVAMWRSTANISLRLVAPAPPLENLRENGANDRRNPPAGIGLIKPEGKVRHG